MEKLITVSVHDKAINNAAMSTKEMREFSETRDRGFLKFHDGVQPCEYTLGDIAHRLWTTYVMATDIEAERNLRAFQCSLERVNPLRQEDGTVLDNWEPTRNAIGIMIEESLQRFTHQRIQEIGGVAFVRSFFGHETRPPYPLPPLSVQLLNEQTYLPADASLSFAAPSKPGASPAREGSTA